MTCNSISLVSEGLGIRKKRARRNASRIPFEVPEDLVNGIVIRGSVVCEQDMSWSIRPARLAIALSIA